MATSVTSVIPTVQTVPTSDLATTRQTSGTGSTSPFQTVLATATADTRTIQTAQATNDTVRADAIKADTTKAEVDAATAEAQATDKQTSDALAAELAGVLVAAQFGVPNAATPLTPANANGNTVAAGQLTPEALNGAGTQLSTNQTAPPTRSNPLFRQFVSEASPQNNTRIATPVAQTTTPTTPTTPAPTAPTTTQTAAQNALTALTNPQFANAGLPGAVAAVQPGQRQVVLAQPPIIQGLPAQPEIGATDVPTPVVAPLAPIETTAVPEARLGDRPGTAGQQFAAIASAAANINVASNTKSAPADFAPIAASQSATATPPTAPTAAALTAVPNVVPAPKPAPVVTTVPAANAAPVLTPNALTPAVQTANVTPVPTAEVPTPAFVPPVVVPNPAPLATAFAPVLAQTNAAPLLPKAAVVEPKVAERDLVDASQTSAFGAQAPIPFSPTANTAPKAPSEIQTPSPAAQIADSIVTHSHVVERGGTTEFQMRLDPPDLGPLRVRLVNNGDGINGQVVVSSDAIRRMIESQLPELRQRLEDAGVSVQGFTVSTDANTGGGFSANTGSDASRPDFATDFGARRVPLATGPPPRPTATRNAGVLDVMA